MIFFFEKNTLLECIHGVPFKKRKYVPLSIVKFSMLKAKNSKKEILGRKAKEEITIENHMDFVKLESFDQCSQILKS